MSDPAPGDVKKIVALRLANAAIGAWDLLRLEVSQVGDLREVAQAYLGALAILFAYVIYSSESMAGLPYTDEDFTEIFSAWKSDVKNAVEYQRRSRMQPLEIPGKGRSGVH